MTADPDHREPPDSSAVSAPAPHQEAPPAPWFRRRIVLVILVAAIVVTFFIGPPAWLIAQSWVSERIALRASAKAIGGDIEGALADIDQAIAWSTRNPNRYYQRAQLRLMDHNLDGALKDVDRLIELNADFANAYAIRGEIRLHQGQSKAAIEDYSTAIRLGPSRDTNGLNMRAYARGVANVELEEALADIQRAIEKETDPPAAYLDTRGYLLYRLDRHDDALVDLDAAIQRAGKAVVDRLDLAKQENRDEAALRQLEERLNEDQAVLYNHRARVHEKLGHADLARADRRRSEELGFDSFVALHDP